MNLPSALNLRIPKAFFGQLRHGEEEISTLVGEDIKNLDVRLVKAAKQYIAKHEVLEDATAEFEFARSQLLSKIERSLTSNKNNITGHAYSRIYGLANKAMNSE